MPDKVDPVAIIGGGPAGSISALCLSFLNRKTVLFEKAKFPRYQIGESLLPGTLSILSRLGLAKELERMQFSKKRAATFIWGPCHEPWTFTFSTPKTRPWTYDHAYQVERTEFDQFLLNTAKSRGTMIYEDHEVIRIKSSSNSGVSSVIWKHHEKERETKARWIIDGSGRRGITANAHGIRTYDPYYKNMALWSYFKGGKRFEGDLEGNIFSVATESGWIWIIPLRNDIYSVGIVTDESINEKIRESDLKSCYLNLLQECEFTMDILANAKRCSKVRATRDWAYEASTYTLGQIFLCGDAACFIDPLFSQGVHLAAYSATLAASAIDFLIDNPNKTEEVQQWYTRSYQDAYDGYHEFLTAFYACNSNRNSSFWRRRVIDGHRDSRFTGKKWFSPPHKQTDEIQRRGMAVAELWRHASGKLSDGFDQNELALRRIRWAGDRLKQFRQMKSVRWTSSEVRLVSTFHVDPGSFKLKETTCLEDENGSRFTNLPANNNHKSLFESSRTMRINFREMARELKKAGVDGLPNQVVGELIEQGFLAGYDSDENQIHVEKPLRFAGVGADDSLS